MVTKTYLCVGLIAVFLIATGCAGPSRVEMDMGTSHKLAIFNQTLDSEAEKNLEPVVGLDSGAARAIAEKYRKDFEKEPPRPIYVLGIGGGR